MDQLICASLSQTHYRYEMGMLEVPANFVPTNGARFIYFLIKLNRQIILLGIWIMDITYITCKKYEREDKTRQEGTFTRT